MTQRTCNIIRCCKGNLYPEISNRIERIKMYMSEECAYPIEYYTDRAINSIMVSAVCDYIDTCDKPSAFLRNILECIPEDLTLVERICSAFALVQIKENDGYVNGFKEEFLDS